MSNGKDIGRNKELVRRCVEEVWNGGRADLIPQMIHPGFRRHHERNPDFDAYGQEGFAAWVKAVRSALPDLHLAVELLFAEDDRVMLHLLGTGTHRGELYGLQGYRAPGSGSSSRSQAWCALPGERSPSAGLFPMSLAFGNSLAWCRRSAKRHLAQRGGGKLMSTEDNKQVVQRFYDEVMGAGRVEWRCWTR